MGREGELREKGGKRGGREVGGIGGGGVTRVTEHVADYTLISASIIVTLRIIYYQESK